MKLDNLQRSHVRRLYIPGAGQNIAWTIHGIERCLPHLFADALQSFEMCLTGSRQYLVQTWNDNAPISTDAFTSSSTHLANVMSEFQGFASTNIDEKLEFLRRFGYGNLLPIIIKSDIDTEFGNWTLAKLIRLREQGRIYESSSTFHTCTYCNNAIAELAADPVSTCKLCGSTTIQPRQSDALFLDIPSPRTRLVDIMVHPDTQRSTIKDLHNRFKLLPPRVFLNKQRRFGIGLATLGFKNAVLDPKIALSFFPEFIAETVGADEVVQLMGASTATNVVPYTLLLKEFEFKYSCLFSHKAPAGILKEWAETPRSKALFLFLYATLLKKVGPMRTEEFQEFLISCGRMHQGLHTAMIRFTQYTSMDAVEFGEEVIESIALISGYVKDGRVLDTAEELRRLVNTHLIGKYARLCRQRRSSLKPEHLKLLKTITPLFFNTGT